jgi:hypothetical protein
VINIFDEVIFDEVVFDEVIDPQYFDDIRKQNAKKKTIWEIRFQSHKKFEAHLSIAVLNSSFCVRKNKNIIFKEYFFTNVFFFF